MPPKKPAPPIMTWFVPMQYTYRGLVTVQAATAEEAERLAKSGDFENLGDGEELVDWEVIGKPRL